MLAFSCKHLRLHPRRLQDVDKLEGVQKNATKIIIRGKKLTYENRLRKLKLPTVTCRQVRGDMIDVYKFLSGKYDINCSVKLQYSREKRSFACFRRYLVTLPYLTLPRLILFHMY